jgi:hypothetical protein
MNTIDVVVITKDGGRVIRTEDGYLIKIAYVVVFGSIRCTIEVEGFSEGYPFFTQNVFVK